MLTAGSTFMKLGVMPLYSPWTPSAEIIFRKRATMFSCGAPSTEARKGKNYKVNFHQKLH